MFAHVKTQILRRWTVREVLHPEPKDAAFKLSLVISDENCKEWVTGMCGCNCIIRHMLLYFSTYCPLLGIIILLVKVKLYVHLSIQKCRLVRSLLSFPFGQRHGFP